jgi:hypothetical protein
MTSSSCGRSGHLYRAIYDLSFKSGRDETRRILLSVLAPPIWCYCGAQREVPNVAEMLGIEDPLAEEATSRQTNYHQYVSVTVREPKAQLIFHSPSFRDVQATLL